MASTCKQCRAEIDDKAMRDPCPTCGSILRDIRIVVEPARVVLTGYPVELIVVRLYTKLLGYSEQLFVSGEHSVAVIVAATACEVVIDRAFAMAFQKKGVSELDEPIGKLIGTNALVREQNRKLYEALTGDQIGQASFWAGYRTLVEHRNAVAHNGKPMTAVDARKDIDSATQFVEHVVKHNGLD
jgi:hypothetical protein